MSVRIQIRRDSSANWVANNPSLREGEIGIELDTLKIKIGPEPVTGDSTPWNSITNYANLVPSDFDSIINGYVEVTDIGAQGGVVGLNSSKNAIIPGSSIIIEGPTNDSYETTLTVTDPTADRTLTLPDVTGTIATEGYVDTAIAAFDALPSQTGNDGKFLQTTGSTTQWATVDLSTKQDKVTGVSDTEIGYLDGVTSAIQTQLNDKQPKVSGVSDTEIGYLDGVTSSIQTQFGNKQDKVTGVSDTEIGYLDGVTSAIQTQINSKSATESPTFTGTPAAPTATAGTNTTQIATTAFVKKAVDDLIDGAPGALDTLNELAAAINDDASYAATISTALGYKAPLESPTFTGTVGLPSTTSIGDVSSTELGYLDGVTSAIQTQFGNKQDKVSGVSDTEIGYLDGVTSAIQTQIDGKLSTSTASSTYQPLVSGVSNTEIGYLDGVTSAIQTQIDNKQAIVANVSDTEIGYLDGVTSGIQTQLNDKLSKTGGTMTGFVTLHSNPESALHAATKQYVDNISSGLNFHQAVHAATSTNITTDYNNGTDGLGATLTAMSNGAIGTVDGHQVVLNDRILVKAQTDAKQNGIYYVSNVGGSSSKWVLTRALDADNSPSGEIANGDFCFVQNGALSGGYGYIVSTTGTITIGTTNINYTQFNAGQTVDAGNGLTEPSVGILAIDTTITADLSTAQTLTNKTINANANTITIASSNVSDFNEAAQDAIGNNVGTGLSYNDTSGSVGIDNAALSNFLLEGASGASYGLIGTSAYLDVKNTNGYNKEIELDIAAVETKLDTDGYITTSSTSTLTNKTLTSPKINENVALTATATELNYVDGVTSAIQTQLDAKAPLASPALTGDATAVNLTVSGNLTVNGTTTNINSTNLVIEDKNIILGDVATPSNITANGGGITLNGDTNKTFNWVNSTSAWTSSEHIDLASGKVLKVAGTEVLSATNYTGKAATAGNADTATNGVVTTGTYSNPSWITGLAWSKISSTPTTISGYGITDGVSTGGSYSDPTWLTVSKSFVGLGNVENTALSTWVGSTNITTLGTVGTGTWNATAIGATKGGTGLTSYASGDILYASATNTLSKLTKGTDGQILTLSSGIPSWAAAPITLPSQSGNSGKYLTTDGSSASWGTLVVPIVTGTATVSSNTASTVDTTALSTFTSVEYMVSLKQGSKIRTSKVIVQTDGTSVDMTEFAITETGGAIAGVVVSASVSSSNCILQVTATDGASTNVTVKFSKVAL